MMGLIFLPRSVTFFVVLRLNEQEAIEAALGETLNSILDTIAIASRLCTKIK
jgi:hypothetical protein